MFESRRHHFSRPIIFWHILAVSFRVVFRGFVVIFLGCWGTWYLIWLSESWCFSATWGGNRYIPPEGTSSQSPAMVVLEKHTMEKKQGTQLGLENAMKQTSSTRIFLVAKRYCFLLREFFVCLSIKLKKNQCTNRLFYNERVAFPLLFESLHVFQAKSCFISCAVA